MNKKGIDLYNFLVLNGLSKDKAEEIIKFIETLLSQLKIPKKVKIEKIEPITFKAKIVCYPNSPDKFGQRWDMTISEVKKVLEGGKYKIELIIPIGDEPTIIISPN